MNQPLTVYQVHVAFIFKDEESGEMQETSLSAIFQELTPFHAIRAGAAWAQNRLPIMVSDMVNDSISSVKIGSVKINTYEIAFPEKDTGYIGSKSTGKFFEWKYDFPGTLDEYVKTTLSGK